MSQITVNGGSITNFTNNDYSNQSQAGSADDPEGGLYGRGGNNGSSKPPILPMQRVATEIGALRNQVNILQGGQTALQIGQNSLQASLGQVAERQSDTENVVKANFALATAMATANAVNFKDIKDQIDKCCGSLHSTQSDTKTPPPKPIAQ